MVYERRPTKRTIYKNVSKKHKCNVCFEIIKGKLEFYNTSEYHHLYCMKYRIESWDLNYITNHVKYEAILKLFNTKYKKYIEEEEEEFKIKQALKNL